MGRYVCVNGKVCVLNDQGSVKWAGVYMKWAGACVCEWAGVCM